MTAATIDDGLAGKLLVAMPGMPDPRFARAVVLVCVHGDEGTMGLIVNRAAPDTPFPELLQQLGIDPGARTPPVPVQIGGPVEPGRGFVLHDAAPSTDEPPEGRVPIVPGLALTTTRDILEDLAAGRGPERAVLALGYAGWGPGQLEGEMRDNGWLVAPASDAILFGADHAAKWGDALRGLGVDPSALSGAAGRA